MKTIRIFISSPGDVLQERKIAHKVITELNKQFSRYIHIEVLMWENFPLTAESTFQEGINYFLKSNVIDFAVFILWSRMGTPLCKKFMRPDGTLYQSGTEYEFDMMMNLYKEKGWPKILTYVKDSEQVPNNLTNIKELEDYLNQKERLRSFITEHFRDEESNSNYAYLQFGANASFEQKFKEHLKVLIKPFLGDASNVKEWEGNPYVGLTSYEFNHNAIFFGRRQLVFDTASALVDFQHPQTKRSLVVLGESGSGKSSFVKAGLLPFLCNDESGDKTTAYRIITPSAYGTVLKQGIVDILVEHFPFLKKNPFIEEISTQNTKDKNFNYLTYDIDNNPSATLLLYIDQFEEVFTDTRISEEERLNIFSLLKGLISTERIHIILSMRNDFYYAFARYEDLDWVKKNCITVDMPIMGSAEILEIIEEPAKKACLKWEVSNTGEGLNHTIVNDALAIRELPLIEFALSELYKKRNSQDALTYSAYEEIGGMEGAIAQYADSVYNKLSEEEKKAFEDILAYVVSQSSASNKMFVRKTALRKDIDTTPLRHVTLNKLIAAHLFVSGKDSNGNATVTITHEVLLRSWRTVAEWIKKEVDFLVRNTYYEESARFWKTSKEKSADLFKERSKLFEAEYYHFKYRQRMSSDVEQFLSACFAADRRKGIVWRIMLFVVSILSLSLLIIMKVTNSHFDPTFEEWTGYNDILSLDVLCFLVTYIGLLLFSIINRLGGKPVYRTIKTSVIIWTCAIAILTASNIYECCNSEEAAYGWIMAIPFFFLWGDKLYTWIQRKRWNVKFTPQRFSDSFWLKVKATVIYVFTFFIIICTSAIYMGALEEKEEIMENRANTADALFRGLNNIKNRLTISDQYYVDTLWTNYLESNFRGELEDTICDEHEFDYAQCMINLKRPDIALSHLYPDENWNHHVLYVKALSCCGEYKKAAKVIEIYLQQCKEQNHFPYNDASSYNTVQFIWPAELAGRFDLAKQIHEQLSDSLNEMNYDPLCSVNYGHTFLSRGELDTAYKYYDQAINNYDSIKISIKRDMHAFSRFGVIPDKLLHEVCSHYKMDFIPAYTSASEDSVLNAHYYHKLNGTWICELKNNITITLNVNENYRFLSYNVYQGSDIIMLSNATVRFEKKNGIVYWDEFSTDDDSNSLGRIVKMTDKTFELEVIDNGDPDQKGERRIFKKAE